MTPDTPAGSRPGSDLPTGLMALLTASATGATFAYLLFGLPGFTQVQEQAPELGVLLSPTAAALAMMVLLGAAQRFSIPGYVATAAGAFLSIWGFGLLAERIGGPDLVGTWIVLNAVGGGIALAGLGIAANASGAPGVRGLWPKAAIAAGFTIGFVFNAKVVQLVQTLGAPDYLPALITCALAIVAAIVTRRSPENEVAGKPGVGFAVSGIAGVVVMVTLLIRGRQMLAGDSGDTVRYTLVGMAVFVAVMFAWAAASMGGPGLAYLPVLGFGLASPMTLVAVISASKGTAWPVIAGALGMAAIVGALARTMIDLPWEVLGVLAAGGGLLLASTSTGDMQGEYLLMAAGGAFALAAGLVRAAVQPAGAMGLVLGFATMMLAAQALGPATLGAFKLSPTVTSGHLAVLPSAAAAVALVILFALSRGGRGTR